MAVEAVQVLISAPAEVDLSAKQFYAVTINSNGNADLAVAAKNIDGVLQNKPVAGQAAAICRSGITKVALSASVNAVIGSLLEADTNRTFKVLASGTAVAKALEASNVAAVMVITAELLSSNAAFA